VKAGNLYALRKGFDQKQFDAWLCTRHSELFEDGKQETSDFEEQFSDDKEWQPEKNEPSIQQSLLNFRVISGLS